MTMLALTFQTTFLATFQVLLMASVGYVCVKKGLLNDDGLGVLSGLLVKVFLPQMIFYHLTQHFSFQSFELWWAFPLLSLGLALSGILVSRFLLLFNYKSQFKNHLTALTAFQNSGYIPLILVANLFEGAAQNTLLVYIFLLIMGFDFGIWSLGVWLVTRHVQKRFPLKRFLNPPFLTTISTLCLIALGLHRFIPQTMLKPVKMFADCTLPLAMIVVGGNLARTRLQDVNKKDVSLLLLGKLFVMPAIALVVVKVLHLGYLLGFLIVLEAAVPSAVTLSVIARHYSVDDTMINQGIFWGTVLSVVTLPLFLGLYKYFYAY